MSEAKGLPRIGANEAGKLGGKVLFVDIRSAAEYRREHIAEAVCNVPLSHFKELCEDRLDILIPFREFEAHREEGKITLRLTKKPDWLTDYDLNPDAIEFILEEQ